MLSSLFTHSSNNNFTFFSNHKQSMTFDFLFTSLGYLNKSFDSHCHVYHPASKCLPISSINKVETCSLSYKHPVLFPYVSRLIFLRVSLQNSSLSLLYFNFGVFLLLCTAHLEKSPTISMANRWGKCGNSVRFPHFLGLQNQYGQ